MSKTQIRCSRTKYESLSKEPSQADRDNLTLKGKGMSAEIRQFMEEMRKKVLDAELSTSH